MPPATIPTPMLECDDDHLGLATFATFEQGLFSKVTLRETVWCYVCSRSDSEHW